MKIVIVSCRCCCPPLVASCGDKDREGQTDQAAREWARTNQLPLGKWVVSPRTLQVMRDRPYGTGPHTGLHICSPGAGGATPAVSTIVVSWCPCRQTSNPHAPPIPSSTQLISHLQPRLSPHTLLIPYLQRHRRSSLSLQVHLYPPPPLGVVLPAYALVHELVRQAQNAHPVARGAGLRK